MNFKELQLILLKLIYFPGGWTSYEYLVFDFKTLESDSCMNNLILYEEDFSVFDLFSIIWFSLEDSYASRENLENGECSREAF